MRITHVCIIHRAFDARIFGRECRTLAEAGHEVHLIAPVDAPLRRDGVIIHPVKKASPQIISAVKSLFAAYHTSAGLKADVYHLHEPLLIPAGILLKSAGAKVVYDVHEDAPSQAKTVGRNKNRPVHGWLMSMAWSVLESIARQVFDAFVCATPTIARRFPGRKTIIVHNFPLQEQFAPPKAADHVLPYRARANHVVFAGGISVTRGAMEMIRAVELLPESLHAELVLIGVFAPPGLKDRVCKMPGWMRTQFTGWLDRSEMKKKLTDVKVAVALFHSGPNHVESLPNKLFEYMAAGLPVVVSDFPLWRQIIRDANCGLCVDPLNPQAIAKAIGHLLENPELAETMGENGRKAVKSRYNWTGQAGKLLALYHQFENRLPDADGRAYTHETWARY